MRVAFFSGDDMPVFTFDAMQKSDDAVRDVHVWEIAVRCQFVAASLRRQ